MASSGGVKPGVAEKKHGAFPLQDRLLHRAGISQARSWRVFVWTTSSEFDHLDLLHVNHRLFMFMGVHRPTIVAVRTGWVPAASAIDATAAV